MKSPSTCPAPKPSCRRCGLRATTPGDRISCASPAPITAGGATCSPASAIPISPHETYTLADMSERTLHVLRTRSDIACVLVNPLQALHPNANAPGDSSLVDSSRTANYDRAAYTAWLKSLREICTRARHRADLRRSLRRLSSRRRRRSGIFRRPRRHGDLRQEPCRRPADRRGLRTQGSDAPLPRRSSRRRLLRPRHLQFASLRHDGDG